MNLKLRYNKDAHIGAVGPSVWAKLGPEDWFSNYVVACANARNYDEPFVIDLRIGSEQADKLTTQNIVNTKEFQDYANTKLGEYRFIVYKPIHTPPQMTDDRFIANPVSFSIFEDKHEFRRLFADKIPIPDYVVVSFDNFFGEQPGQLFAQYTKQFGSKFVVQDNLWGGGQGTFIVESAEDLRRAYTILQAEKKGQYAIISKYIQGIERSVQVFVSASHTIPGPLQQQLVRNSELLNPEGRGGMYFCGGRFIQGTSPAIKTHIEKITAIIAESMKQAGYKGIFGVDFLVDRAENVYVLEVNARTTGLLPLLNEQQSELPLYLLHILELANEPYELETTSAETPVTTGPQSFVVLFNMAEDNVILDESITTGNYQLTGNSLVKLDSKARWNADADVMLQLFCAPDFPSKPNLKVCNIFMQDEGFDDTGQLTQKSQNIIKIIKEHIIPVPAIEKVA